MNIAEFDVTELEIGKARTSPAVHIGAADGEVRTIIIHTRQGKVELLLFSLPGEKVAINLPEELLSGAEHGRVSQMEDHDGT